MKSTNHGNDSDTLHGFANALPQKDCEEMCPECHRRITIGPTGTEYGHAKKSDRGRVEDCPRRPDSFPPL